jgi:hypothetical protein
MKRVAWWAGWTLVGGLAGTLMAAQPVLRVVSNGTGTNLLRNGDFEQRTGGSFLHWSAAPQGYQVAPGEGRNGSTALRCTAPDETGWRGASQTLTLNRQSAAPLIVRGWSRAEGVSGSADSGYSLYADLIYDDGTPLWGQTANFPTSTHDWQFREVTILPEKPVRSLTLHCLLRGHAGTVWFDDVSVTEVTADGPAVLFQGTPMLPVPSTNPPSAATARFTTGDGLRVGLAGARVVSVQLDGRELAGPAPGGFLVRDVAANSDVFAFEEGECPELGLRLEFTVRAHPHHLAIRGRLTNLRGGDRAVLLLFALPVDATGWLWHDNLRESRTISGAAEFVVANPVGAGTTGTMSAYPLAAISGPDAGLALGVDYDRPAQYRLFYHAGTRQFCAAFDLGLVPESEQFPNSAEFGLVLYRFDPAWGFRSAFQKFTAIWPEHFVVRARQQGIWMPFTDVSTVLGWEDFGFRFHEGDNAVAWDDAHDILSFRYTEPMTWWMPMAPELPRTLAEALRVRDTYAEGPPGFHRDMARVSRHAAMYDADGQPALLFRNEPWANGAVWSLNPNPALPGSPNAATLYWNDTVKERLYGSNASARLDGEYLDSLEGYVTADLNFRREHFRFTTVPLSFAPDTHRPALFKGLAIYEFTRWISADVRRLGGLVFANGVPYRYGFLCGWLDVLGTETDWLPGGKYQPASHAQMALWRTLAGAKPYLLLMNTDYDRFGTNEVERYFQRSLFYGMFPSMFSHNAADNPYWRNPAWYNRDRPLFKKYIPLIRRVAEAGWQPVTGARSDNPRLWLERFGPDAQGAVYLTVLNTDTTAQSGVLRVESGTGLARPPAAATELLTGRRLPQAGEGWHLDLPAEGVAVVALEPGPRFVGAESAAGAVRLHIASPPGLTQVLEASRDLRDWTPVETWQPEQAAYAIELPLAADAHRFFRLRW